MGTRISVRNHDSCVEYSESSDQKTFSSFFRNNGKNFEETDVFETQMFFLDIKFAACILLHLFDNLNVKAFVEHIKHKV